MGIIENIQNNIVVIYEIKSFYVTLIAEKFFLNNFFCLVLALPTPIWL
jgi:hypothetical protein